MEKGIDIFIGGSIEENFSINYHNIAEELGTKINDRDYNIIFDGCQGLPSLVFNKIEGSNRVLICHTRYYRGKYGEEFYRYISKSTVLQAIELKNQTEMTNTIINISDAFIFMKGKLGTLEEIFRIINSKKNKEIDKPIVILNVNNEWDDLINILATCNVDEYYHVTDNIIDGLNYIESELFKETSTYNTLYASNSYCKRNYPLIEEIPKQKKI